MCTASANGHNGGSIISTFVMDGTAGAAMPAAATAACSETTGGTTAGGGGHNWRRVGSWRAHSSVNTIIGGATVGEPPSRRREEAAVLQNLHKRVGIQGMMRSPTQSAGFQQYSQYHAANRTANTNKPHLLLKILSNRPGIVTEEEEVNTDWLDSDFIAECLCWHNVYRQRHGVPVLSLCPQLCERAQSWANHLAHTNSFFYKNDKDVGQNLFCRLTNTLQTDVTGQEVASYWYGAVRQYNYFKEPDVLHANVNAGHFTQMVWASTRKFGVGKACSRAGKILVAAHYWPPGNISGQFQENVLPPLPETETDSVSGSDSSTSRSTVELGT